MTRLSLLEIAPRSGELGASAGHVAQGEVRLSAGADTAARGVRGVGSAPPDQLSHAWSGLGLGLQLRSELVVGVRGRG